MKDARFKLKIRSLMTVVLALMFILNVNAQKVSVSGIVKDATGEPIIGASVVEKGTTNGLTTNFNGEFTLSVSPNATLVISYIGYKTQELPVGAQRNLTVTMQEDAKVLGEVVAIGYGTVKKNDATGSVTAIKPDKMNKGQTTNAQDMIAGKIAGVNVTTDGGAPGSGAKIRIRGGSSLSASNDPLIVIDGLAMDNDGIKGVSNFLSTINPNDIETFTVLKDASATAIYGSRASNGVVIITTKKGEKGSKPRLSYDGTASLSTIGKYMNVMKGDEFRSYVKQLYAAQPDVIGKLGTANTDWQKEIYREAFSHDHNIALTGGFKHMPYRISLGYTNQDGILKTTNFERYTGAISLSPSLFNDHLKINMNLKGMLVKNRYADGGVIGSAISMDPTQSITSTDTKYATFGGYWQWYVSDGQGGITDNSLATNNPVALLNQRDQHSKAYDLIGSIDMDYKLHFFPDLHAHVTAAMDMSRGKENTWVSKEAVTNHPHGYTKYDEQNKTNKSLTTYLQYIKELENQSFDVMGGYEYQHFYRYGSYFDKGLDGYKYMDKEINWKGQDFLISFFGRLNYSLLDRYLFTATLRNDGSSKFAKENRWGLFPSFALAWKINNEPFMKDVKSINDFKLRLGYGVTGQQNISDNSHPYLPTYSINKTGGFYPIGNGMTYLPNAYIRGIKWEQTTTYNVGLDLSFFNNRITNSLDLYYRVTNDLLNKIDVPQLTNFKPVVVDNIGSLENRGIEYSINAKIISQKDLMWEVGYNVAYNANKITKLTSLSVDNQIVRTGGISAGTGNVIQAHKVGFPASSFWVYQQVYDNNGKPIEGLFVDRNGDHLINDDDRYLFHKPAADVTMGLTSKIVYKNFDFGTSWRANIGNYVYDDVAARSANVGISGVWSTSGFFSNKPMSALETNFVGRTNAYLSDYYVSNASFIKCDNITVGYSFGKLLGGVISSGRVSATVQNPFIITKYKGLDPEVFNGIDRDIYPRPIMSILGLTLNF